MSDSVRVEYGGELTVSCCICVEPRPGAVSTRNGIRIERVGEPSSCAPTVILYLYCTRRPEKEGGPPAGMVSPYSTVGRREGKQALSLTCTRVDSGSHLFCSLAVRG